MRISDWSSDVCSSDLAGVYAVRPPDRTAHRSVRAGVMGAQAALDGDFGTGGASGLRGDSGHRRQAPALADRGGCGPVDGAGGLGLRVLPRRLADDHPPQARLGRRQRSEEHTSELQSIMRTSYAVFCLKTKTIKY